MAAYHNLMDSFIQLLENKSIHKITVKEIVSQAGCSRGTFYKYFYDTWYLLECIENSIIRQTILCGPLFINYFFHDEDETSLDILVNRIRSSDRYNRALFRRDPKMHERFSNALKLLLASTESTDTDAHLSECIRDITIRAFINVTTHSFQNETVMATRKCLRLEKTIFNWKPELWRKELSPPTIHNLLKQYPTKLVDYQN